MISIKAPIAADLIATCLLIICLAFIIQTVFWLHGLRKSKNKNKRHKQKINTANKVVKRLSTFDNHAAVISYLRKIDAYAFEEALLTAYEAKGHKIKRNKRYSADGGIDGRVKINGEWHFVQAKRYAGNVRSKDIEALSNICSEHKTKGLFIHTGKTPKRYNPPANVKVISGSSLVNLIQVKKPI